MKSIINATIIAAVGLSLTTSCTTTSKVPHPDTQYVHTMDLVTGEWTRSRPVDRKDIRKRENRELLNALALAPLAGSVQVLAIAGVAASGYQGPIDPGDLVVFRSRAD